MMSWNLVLEHLFIVLAASLLSILVGVPLGIWPMSHRKFAL